MSPTLTKFRKLNPTEIMIENSNREFKIFIICYWLTLEFKNKVSEEQIKEALRILSRNMATLNMCLRKDNGHYWFCKMDEEKIPLHLMRRLSNGSCVIFPLFFYLALIKSLTSFVSLNQSPESVFEKEANTCIDSATGPLWCITYITSDETLKENNTFTGNILFTFHHAIIDGYTAINICNSFLKALNDVIGENVQKIYDFGQFNGWT
ncbi:Macrophage migration inhibitory factor [Armadillidium vulgare]|nr:Macrophage migration inhibitory factor [Armadillidium vulgare]